MFFLSPYSSYQATEGNYSVVQRSPTSLAPDTGFMEDNFSTDGVGGENGSGSNASGGAPSLARRSPPAAWPGA